MLPLRDNVPTRTTPFVTVGLIAACFAVWAWELRGPGVEARVFRDGFYPCTLADSCVADVHPLPWYEGLFSSMFMHASWEHILGNMLFFWIFGNNVEDALGHVRFLLWYLAGGIAATAAQAGVTLAFAGRSAASIPNIGASGAVAAVLGAYFVLLPRARVLTLIFFGIILIREIQAVWFLGVWIGFQLWSSGVSFLHPQQGGGVAFFAHIGGFVFGVLTVKLVATRQPRAPTPRYPKW